MSGHFAITGLRGRLPPGAWRGHRKDQLRPIPPTADPRAGDMPLPVTGWVIGPASHSRWVAAAAIVAMTGCALLLGAAGMARAQSVPYKPGAKPPGAKPPAKPKTDARKGATRKAGGIKTEAPAGFENLLKPQRTLVDLFHANRRIGQTFAVYKPGGLRFEKPAAVVKLMGVRKAQAPLVIKALTGWLNTNVGQICSQTYRGQACGQLAPKVAGIIFNEGRLKVTVFVDAKYLEAQSKWRSKFLRSPSKHVSFLSQFDGALAGQTRTASSQFNSNLRMLNLLGWREFRLRSNTNTSPDEGMQVETLAVEWDRRGIAARAGVIRSTGSTLLPEVTLYGGHVGTSGNTRLDLDQAFGSQLSVFLRRQAVVEIIRDGRVLSARFYPSGNQLLDTSSLPGGAYPVTIRIRETDGAVREETRFFSKSSNIPPKDMPLVFAESGLVGRVRDSGLPERGDLPYVNFGGRVRVLENLALGAQFSATDREAAGEANLFFLTRYLRFSLSGVVTSKGDWGVAGAISGSYKRLSGGLSARYIRGPRDRVQNATNPATFRFVGERALQVTANMSWSIRDIDFGVSATVTQTPANGLNWTINPRVRVPLWKKNGHTLAFVGDASFGDSNIQVLGKLVYRWRRPKHLVVAEAGARYRRTASGATTVSDVASVAGSYTLPDYLGHRSTARAGVRRSDSRTQFNAGARSTGPFGRYTASANHSRGGGSANTSFAATLSAGLAIDRKGIAAGGRSRTESAVIVKIRGADDKAKFHVMVDGQPRHIFIGDTTKPIFLRAYRKYAISIRPVVVNRERSFANVDTSPRDVVLYPGTVRTIVWRVVQVFAVFGRAVGPRGAPVANAVVKGVNGVAETDAAGYFQAELKSTSRQLRFQDGKGRECVASLKTIKPRNGFARLGKVACTWRNADAGKTPAGKAAADGTSADKVAGAPGRGAPGRKTRSFLPAQNRVQVSGVLLTFGNSLGMAGREASPEDSRRKQRRKATPTTDRQPPRKARRTATAAKPGPGRRPATGAAAGRHRVRVGGLIFSAGTKLD